MQLRYHHECWPPIWSKIDGPGPAVLDDEYATLNTVYLSQIDPPTTCYLSVRSGTTTYMGTILCTDPDFCRQICRLLQTFEGKTLSEIANVNLP